MDSHQNVPSPLPERLRRDGAATLSFGELLAVIVGGADADAAARSLAAVEGGDESAIADAMLAHVGSSPTLDGEKVALVLASVELGRRLASRADVDRLASRADVDRPVIRGPIDVVRLLLPSMEDLPDEEYRAVCLDAQRSVLPDLNTRQIARDLLASPSTARREEDGGGIPNHTAAIILVHNRPSGDPTPSVDDRALTDRLLDACRPLNLMVFDHVILGRGRYYSFAEAGLL